MGKIYRAKRAVAFARPGGGNRIIHADKIVRDDDPILADRRDLLDNPALFEPLDDYLDRTVEQATAEPGEKRAVSRPRKPRTAKPEVQGNPPAVPTTKSATKGTGADGKEGAK